MLRVPVSGKNKNVVVFVVGKAFGNYYLCRKPDGTEVKERPYKLRYATDEELAKAPTEEQFKAMKPSKQEAPRRS